MWKKTIVFFTPVEPSIYQGRIRGSYSSQLSWLAGWEATAPVWEPIYETVNLFLRCFSMSSKTLLNVWKRQINAPFSQERFYLISGDSLPGRRKDISFPILAPPVKHLEWCGKSYIYVGSGTLSQW